MSVKKILLILVVVVIIIGALIFVWEFEKETPEKTQIEIEQIKLPIPDFESDVSIEQALRRRRSISDYKNEPLNLPEVSQLLWAAQGISDEKEKKRTAPSAGALYPIELYFIAGNVTNLKSGIYKYQPNQHVLIKISEKDVRSELKKAALNQDPVENGAGILVFSAVYEQTTRKYGNRGVRYALLEAGHAAQNVYLQAVSLDLGTVVIGAFDDNKIKEIVNLKDNERPLYLMPVGKK